MQEILAQALGYIRGVWKRRWWVIFLAWSVSLAGWFLVLKMPDQYGSSAKLYVDTQSVLRPLLRGIAIQGDVKQQVLLMTRTLFSRPNLEKVARMADLDLNVVNDAEMSKLLASMKSRATLSALKRQNIYTIGFVDEDPKVAKKVVQAFLTVFVESALGSSRKESNVAQKFLDGQIKEYEARLTEAESSLKEFKQKNIGLMPGSGGDYFSRLERQKAELKHSRDRLAELVSRRDEIKRHMATEEPTLGLSASANIFGEGVAHPLDSRIVGMEARLDELLLNYTDKHPDVVSLRATLARLIDERQKDIDQVEEETPEVVDISPLKPNPVYQQLKISLAQSETEIVSLKTRISKAVAGVAELEGLVDTVPEVEAEMKNLNRDYNIVKKNYEQLLSRRESARVAQDADATGDSVKFDVIEPPRVPLKPTGPNRPLFLSVVLLAGLGVGIALAFLLSQLKQTFDTRASLREAINLPVLGSLSMELTPRQRLRQRVSMVLFLVCGAVLIFAFIVVVLFQEKLSGLIV